MSCTDTKQMNSNIIYHINGTFTLPSRQTNLHATILGVLNKQNNSRGAIRENVRTSISVYRANEVHWFALKCQVFSLLRQGVTCGVHGPPHYQKLGWSEPDRITDHIRFQLLTPSNTSLTQQGGSFNHLPASDDKTNYTILLRSFHLSEQGLHLGLSIN